MDREDNNFPSIHHYFLKIICLLGALGQKKGPEQPFRTSIFSVFIFSFPSRQRTDEIDCIIFILAARCHT
jgi:hypothetical protein